MKNVFIVITSQATTVEELKKAVHNELCIKYNNGAAYLDNIKFYPALISGIECYQAAFAVEVTPSLWSLTRDVAKALTNYALVPIWIHVGTDAWLSRTVPSRLVTCELLVESKTQEDQLLEAWMMMDTALNTQTFPNGEVHGIHDFVVYAKEDVVYLQMWPGPRYARKEMNLDLWHKNTVRFCEKFQLSTPILEATWLEKIV